MVLLLADWLVSVLAVFFVLTSLFMMLVILIQKPKGGGLSGAFGGAGGGSAQAVFGAKVGDVLTWVTVVCFVLFLLLAMGLTWAIHPEGPGARVPQAQQQDQAPAQPAPPAGAGAPVADPTSDGGEVDSTDAGIGDPGDAPTDGTAADHADDTEAGPATRPADAAAPPATQPG